MAWKPDWKPQTIKSTPAMLIKTESSRECDKQACKWIKWSCWDAQFSSCRRPWRCPWRRFCSWSPALLSSASSWWLSPSLARQETSWWRSRSWSLSAEELRVASFLCRVWLSSSRRTELRLSLRLWIAWCLWLLVLIKLISFSNKNDKMHTFRWYFLKNIV